MKQAEGGDYFEEIIYPVFPKWYSINYLFHPFTPSTSYLFLTFDTPGTKNTMFSINVTANIYSQQSDSKRPRWS
jgi:hypothetical protein